jgi:hypothetical protein
MVHCFWSRGDNCHPNARVYLVHSLDLTRCSARTEIILHNAKSVDSQKSLIQGPREFYGMSDHIWNTFPYLFASQELWLSEIRDVCIV